MTRSPRPAARFAVVALALCLIATGCASSGGAGNKGGLSVDYASITNNAGLYKEMTANVKQSAVKLGYSVKTYDNNFDPQTTLKNAQLMAQDNPSAIIEFNGNAGIATSLHAAFSRAGTPCIAVNTRIDGCNWFDLDNSVMCTDTARAVAAQAAARRWTGRNTTVLLVDAATAGPATNTCVGYFYAELQKLIPGFAKIPNYQAITPSTTHVGSTTVQVDGGGQLSKSFDAVQNTLGSIPSNRNIILYTVQDDEAIGGLQAIRRASRTGGVMTAGTGGEDAAIKALRSDPDWVAEGDVMIANLGEYLMAMTKAIKMGLHLPFLTTAPIAVLTKQSAIAGSTVLPISRYFRALQTTPYRLPPLEPIKPRATSEYGIQDVGNAYLAKTGVLQKFNNVDGLH